MNNNMNIVQRHVHTCIHTHTQTNLQ